ncbi:MAG: cysteine-rich KTR domain-containing protein [Clostridiales bacterium]|nr:cysteine-rich KTR domain-containing protein [Clostridiales bacterium]
MNNKQDGARWIHCPICGSKTQTIVCEDTVMFKFRLYCPKCKKQTRTSSLRSWRKHFVFHLSTRQGAVQGLAGSI